MFLCFSNRKRDRSPAPPNPASKISSACERIWKNNRQKNNKTTLGTPSRWTIVPTIASIERDRSGASKPKHTPGNQGEPSTKWAMSGGGETEGGKERRWDRMPMGPHWKNPFWVCLFLILKCLTATLHVCWSGSETRNLRHRILESRGFSSKVAKCLLQHEVMVGGNGEL